MITRHYCCSCTTLSAYTGFMETFTLPQYFVSTGEIVERKRERVEQKM